MNTVIKWGEIPVLENAHKTGQLFEKQRVTHSNYAGCCKYVTDLGRLTKICLATGILLVSFDLNVFAAASGLDEKMSALYYDKFIGIAKVVIGVKGGFDTLGKLLKEDFEGAKKSGIQYLIAFAVMMGLPKALDFIEGLFEE